MKTTLTPIRRAAFAAAACLALTLAPAAAPAALIDFEPDPTSDITSYQEEGFSFDALVGDFQILTPGGNAVLYLNDDGESVRMTQIGGGLFDFLSVDYPVSNSNAIGTITSSKGGLFNLPGGEPGVLNFSGPDWEGVEYIDFTRTGGTFHDIDNIHVEPALSNGIPTPAALPAGLALLGVMTLRRRRA